MTQRKNAAANNTKGVYIMEKQRITYKDIMNMTTAKKRLSIHGRDITYFVSQKYCDLCKTPIGFCQSMTNRTFEIIVDEKYFSTFPNYVKEFVLCHELGHGNDIETMMHMSNEDIKAERDKYALNNNVSPLELRADQYAVEILGAPQSIAALKYMIENVHIGDSNEMLNRIKYIEKEY